MTINYYNITAIDMHWISPMRVDAIFYDFCYRYRSIMSKYLYRSKMYDVTRDVSDNNFLVGVVLIHNFSVWFFSGLYRISQMRVTIYSLLLNLTRLHYIRRGISIIGGLYNIYCITFPSFLVSIKQTICNVQF